MSNKKPRHQRRRLRLKAFFLRIWFKTIVALGQMAAFFQHLFGD